MIYTLKTVGPETEIDLKGRLTFADYSNFREMTEVFSEHKIKKCSFNLSGLDFIDSAGLGMLLIARDKLLPSNGAVELIGAQGQVKKMLELGHFASLFRIV